MKNPFTISTDIDAEKKSLPCIIIIIRIRKTWSDFAPSPAVELRLRTSTEYRLRLLSRYMRVVKRSRYRLFFDRRVRRAIPSLYERAQIPEHSSNSPIAINTNLYLRLKGTRLDRVSLVHRRLRPCLIYSENSVSVLFCVKSAATITVLCTRTLPSIAPAPISGSLEKYPCAPLSPYRRGYDTSG